MQTWTKEGIGVMCEFICILGAVWYDSFKACQFNHAGLWDSHVVVLLFSFITFIQIADK